MGKRKSKDDKLFTLFQKEFTRRFQKLDGKYDIADFAFELFKDKIRMKERSVKYVHWRDKKEFGL